jgi:site-specific recombinase XerD
MAEVKNNRHITFHCARHTFAVTSLIKGVNIYVIKDALGHKSIKTTEIYLNMHDEFRNTEMAKWDAAPEKPKE